jgi:uncharacterized protein (TIGR01777 family)
VAEARAGAPLTVGVTGASGFIGGALCRVLATQAGATVRRFVRGRPAGPGEIAWDPARGVLDPAAIEGLDAIVHLSGASLAERRWSTARKRVLVESRVRSTETLARAIAACARPPGVLVSGSAVGWYGDRGDERLDESSGPGHGFLAELAQAWEAAAAPASRAGVRVAHPRTGLVLARGGGVLAALERPFVMGAGGPLAGGRAWWSWIALEDLLRALVFAIAPDSPLRGPFIAAAPEPVRQAAFARALGRALRRPAVLPAPAFALRLVLGRELVDAMLLASQRAEPRALLAAGFEFAAPTLDRCLGRLYGRAGADARGHGGSVG